MSLDAFFRPRSVAVIGASTDSTKLGHAVIKNLVDAGFLQGERKIYPINPKADQILGLPAFPEVTKVDGPIDLAVIVIPYPAVPAAL